LGHAAKRKTTFVIYQNHEVIMNHYLNKLMTYHLVHQMEREGFSTQKIADHFGMNWRTAKRLLNLQEQDYLNEQEKVPGRKKSLELYEEFVRAKLILHPDTPAAQMHDWLKEQHPDFPQVSQKTVFNFVFSVRGKYNIPKTQPVRDYFCVPELPTSCPLIKPASAYLEY
jgi:hypothetical protein